MKVQPRQTSQSCEYAVYWRIECVLHFLYICIVYTTSFKQKHSDVKNQLTFVSRSETVILPSFSFLKRISPDASDSL